ncbi:MAG: diguanylate cyclase [Candidatus Omnitrophica bacterium]|nr:diguanylate cyclase [Candidatus Omnitrophota bacterium]
MEEIKKILIISSDKNLREVLNFCFDGWGYEVFLRDSLIQDITPIKKISPDVIVVDVHSASKAQLEICHILKDEFTTNFIPIITLINKRQLKRQLLNLKYGVDDYLIKPPDPLDLRVRVEMAIKRAQYSFYATPLTGLPSGRIIEEALKDRLKKRISFSFGYVDIDNFKSFNDVYGYIKGDSVIMQTAYILYTVIKRFGNKDDFIGHIGGDDFVFITTPEEYKEICQNFILMFDRIISFHYSPEDRKQGFIITKDRTHKIKRISLMSVSIAVVNKRNPSESVNLIEISERIAEIKRYLKSIPGSKFMAERRNRHIDESLTPQIYKKQENSLDSYKPLGQILVEKNVISSEQLDEALRIHWKRGVILGDILKELGFLKEEELKEALNTQTSNL